jgi:hypothetical protein
MNECLKGSLVRLTHGLGGTRRERPVLHRWQGVDYNSVSLFSLWMVKRSVMFG